MILGGGMASLVTAFELTRTPELRRRHEITVLQHGHRLGGKGASGVNVDQFHRIEEHGLHVLFGFYANVFRVLRECYGELGRALQSREEGSRLASQYHCAVAHPSDRYVLSIPGSVHWRLRADESGYRNLVLAGDWTKTALSLGCLEAAAMSGFAAARAIDSGCRRAYGDWLPERSRRPTVGDVSGDASSSSAGARRAPRWR